MGPVRTPSLRGQGECSLSSGSKTNIQPTRVPLPRANPQGGIPRGTMVPTVGGIPGGRWSPHGGCPQGEDYLTRRSIPTQRTILAERNIPT